MTGLVELFRDGSLMDRVRSLILIVLLPLLLYLSLVTRSTILCRTFYDQLRSFNILQQSCWLKVISLETATLLHRDPLSLLKLQFFAKLKRVCVALLVTKYTSNKFVVLYIAVTASSCLIRLKIGRLLLGYFLFLWRLQHIQNFVNFCVLLKDIRSLGGPSLLIFGHPI